MHTIFATVCSNGTVEMPYDLQRMPRLLFVMHARLLALSNKLNSSAHRPVRALTVGRLESPTVLARSGRG